MAGARYTINTNDIDKVQERLNQLLKKGEDMTPVFQDIGEMLLLSHDQRFRDQKSPDGVPWAPLSVDYQKAKKQHKDEILTLNKFLSGNLAYQASYASMIFGTPMEYGAIHHFGGSPNMRPT